MSCCAGAMSRMEPVLMKERIMSHSQTEAGKRGEPEPVQALTNISPPEMVKTTFAMSMRPSVPQGVIDNKFALVTIPLPTGIMSPEDRLRILSKQAYAIKKSSEMFGSCGSFRLLSNIGRQKFKEELQKAGDKHTAVYSNLLGPRDPLKIGGKQVVAFVGFTASLFNTTVHWSVQSFYGKMSIGLYIDYDVSNDPARFLNAFLAEFTNLESV
uniref:O-acyltransferase WSD1 C-terminal domain-containing protein n=1 Tax=Fibrocapsa japonica TaxID=94617 RepID=A0A7S2UZ07_9STRA